MENKVEMERVKAKKFKKLRNGGMEEWGWYMRRSQAGIQVAAAVRGRGQPPPLPDLLFDSLQVLAAPAD
jgi:hypothetical protein